MIKIDYHFHPNFSFYLPFFNAARARKYWKKFEEHGISLVFCSEHAYKRPEQSFHLLNKYRPKNSKTYLVPAVEALTKEGVDIVVFARYPQDLYSKKTLIKPFGMGTKKLIDLIQKNSSLFAIVVHPFTPGTTSIYRTVGKKITERAISVCGFVEKNNGSMGVLKRLFLLFGLSKLLRKKYQQIAQTDSLPEGFFSSKALCTVGSDAHHPFEVGDASVFDAQYKNDYDYLFKVAFKDGGKTFQRKDKPIFGLFVNMFTVFKEWFIKKII